MRGSARIREEILRELQAQAGADLQQAAAGPAYCENKGTGIGMIPDQDAQGYVGGSIETRENLDAVRVRCTLVCGHILIVRRDTGTNAENPTPYDDKFVRGLLRTLRTARMIPSPDDLDIFERQTSRKLTRTTLSDDVSDSISRYEDMLGGGRTGVMTPFTRLNEITGGLKPGNLIVVGAPSGGYKTTFALNLARHVAMTEQVALFSLEMTRQEILDIMFSMTLNIDRNHFNTGKFSKEEMDGISFRRGEVERLKLAIFDDAFVGVDEVRADCLSLSCDEPLA